MSAPIVDDRVVIIGRLDDQSDITSGLAFQQLLRPFQWKTWLVFISIFLTLMLISHLIIRGLISDVNGSTTNAILLLLSHVILLRGALFENEGLTISPATSTDEEDKLYMERTNNIRRAEKSSRGALPLSRGSLTRLAHPNSFERSLCVHHNDYCSIL